MREPLIHVEFDNELNDDVLDANGELLALGGRPLADVVSEYLRSRGLNVSSVAQRDYYGWDFRWRDGWNLITAVLQHGGPNGRWLIVVRDRSLVGFFCPKMARTLIQEASLMLKDALEATGVGKNVTVVEGMRGGAPGW
jgi:hypothetical protein